MAPANTTPRNNGRKWIGVIFTSVAVVAVILGVIGGLKPELLGKHSAEQEAAKATTATDKAATMAVSGDTKATTTVLPNTPKVEKDTVDWHTKEPPKVITPAVATPVGDTQVTVVPPAAPAAPAPAKSQGGIFGGISSLVSSVMGGSPPSPETQAATAPWAQDSDAMAGVVGYANSQLSKNYVEPGISAEASNMLSNNFANQKNNTQMIQDFVTGQMKNQIITSMQSGAACAPATTEALQAAIDGDCAVITLVPGATYGPYEEELKITKFKLIIGNPLLLPLLDGSGAERLFHVMPGGILELRFVMTYRGGGRLVNTIPVLQGGSIMAELGSFVNVFGCLFTNAQPKTPVVGIAPDISRAVRIFGGQIYNAGGVIVITASHFVVLQPGVLIREFYVMGGDILVASGVLIFSASTISNTQMFLNGAGVGFMLCQLTGVMVVQAVVFLLNTGVIHASGAGILVFLGGGVAIFNAVVWNANLGMLAHFGAGIFLFVGAGVVVANAAVMNANVAIGIECGVGAMIALGAGQLTINAMTFSFDSGVNFIAEGGVFIWVGAGSLIMTATSHARTIGTASVYGVGGNAYNCGITVSAGMASIDAYGVASIALPGGNWFQSAGLLVETGSVVQKSVGCGSVIIPGLAGFVGGGSASVTGVKVKASTTNADYVNVAGAVYWVRGSKQSGSPFWYRERELDSTTNIISEGDAASICIKNVEVDTAAPSKSLSYVQQNAKGDAAQTQPLDVSVANVAKGAGCAGCGDLKFTGDGAGACAVDAQCSKDSCGTADAPSIVNAALGSLGPDNKLKQMFVVTGKAMVSCSQGDGTLPSTCTSAANVQKALQNMAVMSHIGCNYDMRVQPSSTPLPKQIPATDSSGRRLEAAGDGNQYVVSLVTYDKGCAKSAENWFKSPGDTMDVVSNALAGAGKVNQAAVDVMHDATHSVNTAMTPQSMASSNADAASGTSVAPVLNLLPPAGSTDMASVMAPIPTYSQNSNLPIQVANFSPKGGPVNLAAISSTGAIKQLASLDLPQTASGDAPPLPVNLNIALQNLDPGFYTIKASQAKSPAWASSVKFKII